MIPANHKSPTGTDKKVAGAQNNFKRRLNVIYREINNTVIKPLESKQVALNDSAAYILNKEYVYQLDAQELNRLDEIIASIIDRNIMVDEFGMPVTRQTGERLWFFGQYVEAAYKQGTNQSVNELSAQSVIYDNAISSVEEVLYSPEYQTRIGLVAAREFNNMRGFTDDVIKEARFVLGDGIALGQGIDQISRRLKDRIGVSESRSRTIARTEITYALRKAKRDEAQSADNRLGIKSKLVWMASMLPNMRPWHFSRTGKLYTREEIDEIYSKPSEAINCRCTQLTVVLDDNGEPLNPKIVERLATLKEKNKSLMTVNLRSYF